MKDCGKHLIILWCCVLSLAAHAQSTHWGMDAYAYQYDMTVYFTLTENGQPVSEFDNYEVAAFVGDECRGVGQFLSYEGTNYGYLRIRSNQQQGETIIFKVYMKDINSEVDVENYSITFASQGVMGLPSDPQVFDVAKNVLMGDVNGDGKINSVDLSLLIGKILGKEDPRFIDAAGDLSGDGKFNSVDLSLLIKLILNQ